MPLQTDFQWHISVDWNRNTGILSSFGIDMMTAIYSLQFPAFGFNKLAEFLTADSFQMAISITLSFPDIEISCTSTDKQPSTAS